jgi:hypothetical protein
VPKFFFHTDTHTRFIDEEGTECSSHVEARRQAIQTCGELMRNCPENFWGSRPWNVTVTAVTGLILWEISLDGTASPAAAEFANTLPLPG